MNHASPLFYLIPTENGLLEGMRDVFQSYGATCEEVTRVEMDPDQPCLVVYCPYFTPEHARRFIGKIARQWSGNTFFEVQDGYVTLVTSHVSMTNLGRWEPDGNSVAPDFTVNGEGFTINGSLAQTDLEG